MVWLPFIVGGLIFGMTLLLLHYMTDHPDAQTFVALLGVALAVGSGMAIAKAMAPGADDE
jgi:hypothetical protein